ncbi:MAG: hypothetical protein U0791_04360 [Gemmataceae bacterium]
MFHKRVRASHTATRRQGFEFRPIIIREAGAVYNEIAWLSALADIRALRGRDQPRGHAYLKGL